MAEQEVAKHVKKTYKIWNSKEHSFWHKLREFMVEICIIVFAVSLSIWFHDRSDHRHEQKEVKDFLLGLKNDLNNDIQEMKQDKVSYSHARTIFQYISSVRINDVPSPDSLNKYYTWIFSLTGLIPNNGRFEGFKSSGKLGNIEDITLQNDILDLYQENIPALLASSDDYSRNKKELFRYINQHRKRLSDSTSNLSAILATDEAKNLSEDLVAVDEIVYGYDACIEKATKIIAEIEKEYKKGD